jgi:small subunit ribosomal protein S6
MFFHYPGEAMTDRNPDSIARSTGSSILSSGGVIRGITNWGNFSLPRRVHKHQARHHSGHYFVMQFDSNTTTQEAIRQTLTLDPRMIRFSVVKMGSTLDAIKEIDGKIRWSDGSPSMAI